MILLSATRVFLLIFGYVTAFKIDLGQECELYNFTCTISECYSDPVIENSNTTFPFSELVFQNCYFPAIPSVIFSIAPKLERLLMYKCSIRSIQQTNFLAAGQIRSLFLPNNRLTELPEKIFANLSMVEEIRLANNHISHMHPKAFTGLTQLRVLELNNNKIHELATDLFSNLTNLEYIDVSFNDIEAIDTRAFQMNLRLKTVLLNNNNFAVFESNSLAHLPHLNMLDISYNNINIIHLRSVDTLRALNSQLRSCVISGSVIKIRASSNQLESISITDKSSVKEIDVHSNQFTSLSDFHGMLNLQKLDVSKNAIRSLNSTNTSFLLDLPNLQYLNVAYGQLKEDSVITENFVLLSKLSHLDLAYNNIRPLEASIFEPLVNLEKFYFEGNHLHSFAYEVFLRNHANVKEMGIFGNDWQQTYLKKMSDVLKANNIKLVVRFNELTNEANEMLSVQTTNHPHHIVHAKTLDQGAATPSPSPGVNNRDILIIITLCLVLVILVLQLFRILKEENLVAGLCEQRISRTTIRSTRLDEEESEPL